MFLVRVRAAGLGRAPAAATWPARQLVAPRPFRGVNSVCEALLPSLAVPAGVPGRWCTHLGSESLQNMSVDADVLWGGERGRSVLCWGSATYLLWRSTLRVRCPDRLPLLSLF